MQGNFERCIEKVLLKEGGYVNNPLDAGRATNYGITMATLASYRMKNVTPIDVKNLDVKEARDIYRARYWNPMRCDMLPLGVDYACFDAAVNSGSFRASKWLQTSLGVVADGVIGDKTLNASKMSEPLGLINNVCSQRMKFCLSLDNDVEEAFEKGWANRILSVLQQATIMNMKG